MLFFSQNQNAQRGYPAKRITTPSPTPPAEDLSISGRSRRKVSLRLSTLTTSITVSHCFVGIILIPQSLSQVTSMVAFQYFIQVIYFTCINVENYFLFPWRHRLPSTYLRIINALSSTALLFSGANLIPPLYNCISSRFVCK